MKQFRVFSVFRCVLASATAVAFVVAAAFMPARAQDVPGIEICTAEKTMERRTGCLQSNVDFLQKSITKLGLEHQQKIDAANRQIDGLKLAMASLQKTVEELKAQIAADKKAKEPAAK